MGQMAQMGPDLGAACPKNGVSYFRKKWFGVFGGCNGARHVPKTGFLISGKKHGWVQRRFLNYRGFDMWVMCSLL
jgi:hypothetical protein